MADLFQGSALPNITSTKTDVTSGPSWYNTYLQDLAQTGTQAMQRTPEQAVAGFTPLQTAAIGATPAAASSYQPFLQGAETALGKTAGLSAAGAASPYVSTAAQTVPGAVGEYMDPYQQQVVDEIGRLGYQNIRQNLRPLATARSVSTGDFGSKRGEEILGQTIQGALSDITGQQSRALSTGYASALAAAQADKQRQLQAGQLMGTLTGTDLSNALQEAQTRGALGTTAQTLGLRGTEATFGAGEQEQKLNQARMNAPLTQATNAANIFTNLKVPTTVSQVTNAPVPGAYANSPLSQIAGLGTLFSSGSGGSPSAVNNVLRTVLGDKNFQELGAKGLLGVLGGSSTTGGGTGGTGGGEDYSDQSGNPSSPVYGMYANEDGTYTSSDGSIYSRNGTLLYGPVQAPDQGGFAGIQRPSLNVRPEDYAPYSPYSEGQQYDAAEEERIQRLLEGG